MASRPLNRSIVSGKRSWARYGMPNGTSPLHETPSAKVECGILYAVNVVQFLALLPGQTVYKRNQHVYGLGYRCLVKLTGSDARFETPGQIRLEPLPPSVEILIADVGAVL